MDHDFAINRFHSFDVPLLEVLETFSMAGVTQMDQVTSIELYSS
jgi:hypothetical protein